MKGILIRILCLALVFILSVGGFAACNNDNNPTIEASSEASSEEISSEATSSEEISSEASSSETLSSNESSSNAPTSSRAPSSSGSTSSNTRQPESGLKPPSSQNGIQFGKETNIVNPNDGVLYNKGGSYYDYKTPMDMEDNVFMDSLIYTGYRVDKQRADGLMWQYILASKKNRHHLNPNAKYSWLSKISYDYDGGSSGYETNAEGKPDIAFYEKGDLVCASYVGYVYQNYLPNVVGIDTSIMKRPRDYGWSDVLADGWYEVGKMWVKQGYSEFIPFAQGKSSFGCLKITPEKSIPIGSLMVTTDGNKPSDYASHVSIYAGYKYGYNWVFQVGSDNGPEFSCIERMAFLYPQKLIAIITPPKQINFAPELQVTVKDEKGNAVSGAKVVAKRDKNGKEIEIGTTDDKGFVSKDYLYYDGMTVTVTAADGKTASAKITLTAKENSVNKLSLEI